VQKTFTNVGSMITGGTDDTRKLLYIVDYGQKA
jgi:hypothetical protein